MSTPTPEVTTGAPQPRRSRVRAEDILSGIMQAHRAKEEHKRKHMATARRKQQEIALLHHLPTTPESSSMAESGGTPDQPPSGEGDEEVAALRQRVQRLELELANLKGQKLEYLSLAQLEQLRETLGRSTAALKERRRKVKASRKEAGERCVVCMEERKNVVFQCGHLVTCPSCSLLLTSCPACREAISNRITIHGD
ncbi:MAG: RING-HC finger protein [archaeon]|nr:RING-HC finger protein [archaeon]